MTAMRTTIRTDATDTGGRRERLGAAAVYAAGGVLYFVAREVLGVGFLASPLLYGLIVLAASVFRPRLRAPAVLLTVWGAAVLLDGHGPIAEGRSAAVYIAGFGLGALLLRLLERWIDTRAALESLAAVILITGVWFYFAEAYEILTRPWLWSAWLLLSAGALAFTAFLPHTTARSP